MAIRPIPQRHAALADSPGQHGASLFRVGPSDGSLMVPTTTTGTLALTNGRLYLTPAYLPRRVQADDIAVQVNVAAAAGGVLRVGLYADNGNAAPEGDPLHDFGTIDLTGVGFRSAPAGTFPILGPALVWIASAAQGSPATQATLVAATGVIMMAPTSWMLPADSSYVGVRKSADDTLGALPTLSPAPSFGLQSAPRVAILCGAP